MYPTAEEVIHRENSFIFWFNNRVYHADNNLRHGNDKMIAFQLFHMINGWTDMGIRQVDESFNGVLLPKNKEIAFYYYLKQLQ